MILIRCKVKVDPLYDDGWAWMDLPFRCLCRECRKKWAKLDRMAEKAKRDVEAGRTVPLNTVLLK